MILSAVSLWKKFNLENPLGASEWGIEEKDGVRYSHVSFSGNAAPDGRVRVYARFGRPVGEEKKPCILLLPDAGKALDMELMEYDMPRIKIRVRCSKGPYIRSLAFEIGEALQSGAYLSSLRRTRSGGYRVEEGHTLDEFMEKLRERETK